MTQFTTEPTIQQEAAVSTELSTLLNAISQLSGQISNLSVNQDRLQHQIDVLTTPTQIEPNLVPSPAQIPSINTTASTGQVPKVKLPEKFVGKRDRFRGFINQLELVFSLQPNVYNSNVIKISTFGTLLDGTALSWFLPYIERNLINSLTWDQFKSLAYNTFGDPCRKLSSESKLMSLSQKGSLVDYVSEFGSLSTDVDWNQSTLVSHFRRGLNPKILDLMLGYDIPTTLHDLITLATKIDNRIWENNQMQKNQKLSNPTAKLPTSTANPAHQPTVRFKDPDAMELDSAKRGPLSQAEKDRRQRLNLCRYCGDSSHVVANCTLKPNKSINASEIQKDETKIKKTEEGFQNGH